MRFDATQEIKELDGTTVEVTTGKATGIEMCPECSEKWRATVVPMTARLVCTRSLTAMTQRTQGLSEDERFAWGELAHKIYNSDEPSLSADDVITLRKAIGWHEGPHIVFVMRMLLEPPDLPDLPKEESQKHE